MVTGAARGKDAGRSRRGLACIRGRGEAIEPLDVSLRLGGGIRIVADAGQMLAQPSALAARGVHAAAHDGALERTDVGHVVAMVRATVAPDGNRGQVFAIGPSVKYRTEGGTHAIGQWQHESHVENRFGGDKFWLKLIVPL